MGDAKATVEAVRADATAKVEGANKEADSLRSTLMEFMKHAHSKLFSKEAQDRMAAQEEATKSKGAKDEAQDALHKSQLELAVAETNAKTHAEKLKNIMTQISEDSNDHELLKKLSGEAQATKGEMLAAAEAEKSAREKVAEKQQA